MSRVFAALCSHICSVMNGVEEQSRWLGALSGTLRGQGPTSAGCCAPAATSSASTRAVDRPLATRHSWKHPGLLSLKSFSTTLLYLSWVKTGVLVGGRRRARLRGREDASQCGCGTSHGGSAGPRRLQPRLFVVLLLRREEGYFPEPQRRISIARPPSAAAHMTGDAGKPPKTSHRRDT